VFLERIEREIYGETRVGEKFKCPALYPRRILFDDEIAEVKIGQSTQLHENSN